MVGAYGEAVSSWGGVVDFSGRGWGGAVQQDPPTRVAVIDDHVLFAEALRLALQVAGLDVVHLGAGTDGPGLPALVVEVTRARPDVLMLDLDLGDGGDGARLVGPFTAAGVSVLVVTATENRERWGQCLHLGAVGVLVKTSPLQAIVAAVDDVRRGRPVLAEAERLELMRTWREATERRRRRLGDFARLTRREREVLLELAHGRRIQQIAASAVVAESTVRSQVKSILAKLGVTSQLAAVSLAHETGWAESAASDPTGRPPR
ncbi:response regulator transcription factor [Nocardioides lentus]|uniref:Response regulator transcription factor n=1 Tax=Nocardioides lentus TaxID=338077 RepID=A0ABN2P7D2_9ACTN